MTLTAKDVAEITRLLEESSFNELSLELDGLKLTLRRNGAAAAAVPGAVAQHAVAAQHALAAAPGAIGASARPEAGAPSTPPSQPGNSMIGPSAGRAQAGSSGGASSAGAAPASAAAVGAADTGAARDITAPLLGTFYRAPKPGAPPFVEVGSAVEEETIIGIIEVMKLMNTVRAGTSGRVVDILAKDGALVEYGETLMRVSRAAQA